MQAVAAIGHVYNILAMQGLVGHLVTNVTRGIIVVHAGLLGAQTVFVVLKGDLIIALLAQFPLCMQRSRRPLIQE